MFYAVLYKERCVPNVKKVHSATVNGTFKLAFFVSNGLLSGTLPVLCWRQFLFDPEQLVALFPSLLCQPDTGRALSVAFLIFFSSLCLKKDDGEDGGQKWP